MAIICSDNLRHYRLFVENPDSLKDLHSSVLRNLANLGYWRIVDNIQEADMVIAFTEFNSKVYHHECVENYVKIFDNKMNFLYRSNYRYAYSLSRRILKKLPSELKKAKISTVSPYYVETVKRKEISDKKQKKLDKYYDLALEALRYKENKKALSYLDKCIKIEKDNLDLYEKRGLVLLDLGKYKDAQKDFKKLLEYVPLHTEVDRWWQNCRYGQSVKDINSLNKWLAISTMVGAVSNATVNVAAAISNSSATAKYSPVTTAQGSNLSGSSTREEKCTHCNGTGVNPVATSVASFGGSHYCNVCKQTVSDSHGYHGHCPSCNGKGYRIRIR